MVSRYWCVCGVWGSIMLQLGRNPVLMGILGLVGLLFVINLVAQTLFSYQLTDITRQWFSMVVRIFWNGPVAQGGSFRDMTEIYERLQSKMALPGEPAANVRRLHVLVVNFYDAPAGMTHGRKIPAKMSQVSLDLGAIGDAGYVIFYNAPTMWRVRRAGGKRARLGFDSRAPMDVSPNPDGIIAGLRVAPLTGRSVWGMISFRYRRDPLCYSMRRWLRIFDKSPWSVKVWDAQMPLAGGTLQLLRNGPKSDTAGISRRGSLRMLCNR